MPVLSEIVRFDLERLFNGAIDVDWIATQPEKAKSVSESFVFHGPAYHGVSQSDIADTGHRLIDSASFFRNILDNLKNDSGQPFTLAIAGFGSGKSHLALTLSELLETDDEQLRNTIIDHIAQADINRAEQIRRQLVTIAGRTLVITLNGMNNFDLSAEILSQVKSKLHASGISTEPLDKLRQRFSHAVSILKNFDTTLLTPLLTELNIVEQNVLFEKLDSFDETVYAHVHDFLESLGIPLIAIGDETAKDVLKTLATQYIGEDKPFSKILLQFDEFGRYLEFATTKSQVAGNGALQQLYEGVQENSDKIVFVGFIQYELKAYEQRLPAEFKNDIRRFITRFQSSEKLYLSINLETLIASLIVKDPLSSGLSESETEESFQQIHKWYPAAKNHSLWNSEEMFSRVVGSGCWPLSPLSVWLLFHLSAGGQYLQQRSALSLLKTALEENASFVLSDECPTLPPVRLWSHELQSEFIDVEEQSGYHAIVQSYLSVLEKYRQHLSDNDILTLRSIVLVSITRLKADSRDDAMCALSAFSGIAKEQIISITQNMEDEWNILSWDDAFHQFDIIGDSVSKSQFLKFLRHKIDSEYDLEQQSKLFIQKASLVPELLQNIECDFSSEQKIFSAEWVFEKQITYWDIFQRLTDNIVFQHLERIKYCQVDTPRGIVVYCYVPENENIEDVKLKARSLLRASAAKRGCSHIPVLLALIHDSGEIGRIMSEIDIIEKLSTQERELYGKIASVHSERRIEALKEEIKKSLLHRDFVTTIASDQLPLRLTQIGNYVFEKIYPKALSFPFDNYRSARTNAASDCADFTRKLLLEDFLYDNVQSMPPRQQNRANSVLKDAWKIFNKDGSVAVQPGYSTARAIVIEWDRILHGETEGLNCGKALEYACAAPFGANIASAGLLFAVYLQARKNTVFIEENGQHTDWQTISPRLFEQNQLSIQILSSLVLFRNENNESEWEQLLNDWGNAESYVARTEFAEQADDLEKRLHIPRVLKWKEMELRRLSDEAKVIIDNADEKESKGIRIIDKARSNNNDVFNISYGASLLIACGAKKKDDPMWRIEDYSYLADYILEAKQIIIQNFTEWLNCQRPQSGTQAGLLEFRSGIIDKMERNLKSLELSEQLEQLKQYYDRISRSFERVAECQQALTDVRSWLANNKSFPNDLPLIQLRSLEGEIRAQADLLRRPKSAMTRMQHTVLLSEIEEVISSLQEMHKKVQFLFRSKEDSLKKIRLSQLAPNNAKVLQDKLLELERFYVGAEQIVTDLRMMRQVADLYIGAMNSMRNLSISSIDFNNQMQTAEQGIISQFADAGLSWDLKQSFDLLKKECTVYRQNASLGWLNDVQKRMCKLSSMSVSQANELLSVMDTPPPYVDYDSNKKMIEDYKQQIESFLDSKEIEWLLERFKKMSKSARAKFLEALKQEEK